MMQPALWLTLVVFGDEAEADGVVDVDADELGAVEVLPLGAVLGDVLAFGVRDATCTLPLPRIRVTFFSEFSSTVRAPGTANNTARVRNRGIKTYTPAERWLINP